ncbi:MAG: LysR family transcriptional regulator [Thermodesulfobacteriaceae bacterium]|nr:LysR family transcriptional regulator [Thermodesulfobacteriaceae bacterium]
MRRNKNKHKSKEVHRLCEITSPEKGEYQLKGRFWIEGKEGTFLGYGRVILLERIKEYGSISLAAKSMNMSYRHAWELVNSMNRQSKTPLVVSLSGGKGGGGTILTETGEKAIQTFWKFYEDFKKFLEEKTKEIEF